MQKEELQNRNFGLDLVRALAIIFVLICHSLSAFYPLPQFKVIMDYTGILGVDLFFVLSGFLIGTILTKIHAQQTITSFKSVKSFWVRRWFRTLPNYLLVFVIYLLVFKAYNLYIPYKKLPLYFTFLQTCFTRNQFFFGVAWSLSIEEWFYLLFPLGLLVFQRFVSGKTKSLLINIACFVLACTLLRAFVSLHMHNEWDEGFRKQMPLRLDSIAIGVLAAVVKFYYLSFWNKYKSLLAFAGVILFCAISAVLYYGFLQYRTVMYAGFFINVFYFPVMNLAMALLLPLAYSWDKMKWSAIRLPVTLISILSYSVYLIHPIFSYLIPYYLKNQLSPATMFVLLWICTFGASYLIYNFFEKRVTKLRDGYSNKNEPAAA